MKTGKKTKKIPGSSDENRLLTVCKLLNKQRAKYLVVGGLACNLHGLIRATKDIDVLIPKDEKNTEKILAALGELPFGVAKELDIKEVSEKPMTIVGDIPRVDLLTVANTVKYEQAEKTALQARISHVLIPYVDYPTLVKTKQTDRLQDKADLEQLEKLHKPS